MNGDLHAKCFDVREAVVKKAAALILQLAQLETSSRSVTEQVHNAEGRSTRVCVQRTRKRVALMN